MNIKLIIEHWVTWFKAHERLVLLLAIGFFGVHFYGKYIDYRTKQDQTQAQIAHEAAQAASTKFSDSEQKSEALLQQLGLMQQQIISQNQRIDQSMRDRAKQTQDQKNENANSVPSDLAAKLQKLLGVGTVKVETSSTPLPDALQVSIEAARANADKLADLSQAQGDVKDLNTKLVTCQTLTVKQADTITGLSTTVTNGVTALKAEQDSHTKDVKKLNDDKRGAYLKGAKIGGVIAVIAVEAFRIFLGRP